MASKRLLRKCVEADYKLCGSSWYARVPSHSNIADGPSRDDFREVAKLPNAKRIFPAMPSDV
eukprot:248521-Amphidinium_carterae.1